MEHSQVLFLWYRAKLVPWRLLTGTAAVCCWDWRRHPAAGASDLNIIHLRTSRAIMQVTRTDLLAVCPPPASQTPKQRPRQQGVPNRNCALPQHGKTAEHLHMTCNLQVPCGNGDAHSASNTVHGRRFVVLYDALGARCWAVCIMLITVVHPQQGFQRWSTSLVCSDN